MMADVNNISILQKVKATSSRSCMQSGGVDVWTNTILTPKATLFLLEQATCIYRWESPSTKI